MRVDPLDIFGDPLDDAPDAPPVILVDGEPLEGEWIDDGDDTIARFYLPAGTRIETAG